MHSLRLQLTTRPNSTISPSTSVLPQSSSNQVSRYLNLSHLPCHRSPVLHPLLIKIFVCSSFMMLNNILYMFLKFDSL
uniref:Ovule protein n=1 Tax=Panagrellus redivivus TaxID=6233 RepID=A0A7E4VJX2_PANRE